MGLDFKASDILSAAVEVAYKLPEQVYFSYRNGVVATHRVKPNVMGRRKILRNISKSTGVAEPVNTDLGLDEMIHAAVYFMLCGNVGMTFATLVLGSNDQNKKTRYEALQKKFSDLKSWKNHGIAGDRIDLSNPDHVFYIRDLYAILLEEDP